MPDLFFEDFIPGADLPEASLTVAAEDADFFAQAFDPGAAEPGVVPQGEPPLSSWHVAALGMRLLCEAFLGRTASLGAPGIDSVAWTHPVRVGDTLRLAARVVACRVSASRPEMGLVTVAIALFNQDGARVMTQDNAVMVGRRGRAGRSSTEERA